MTRQKAKRLHGLTSASLQNMLANFTVDEAALYTRRMAGRNVFDENDQQENLIYKLRT